MIRKVILKKEKEKRYNKVVVVFLEELKRPEKARPTRKLLK